MAYRQCRFCPVSVNGELAVFNHERNTHPKLFWQAKAELCRRQAQSQPKLWIGNAERLLEEAERYDRRAEKEE